MKFAFVKESLSEYCVAAHSTLGKMAGLQPNQLIEARKGLVVGDPEAQAVLKFATAVLESRGDLTDSDLAAARSAGLGDPQIAEIVAHVALNVFTNYFNRVAHTEIDFPKVQLAL